jgi:single-stranded-DNA-specific exonuclease
MPPRSSSPSKSRAAKAQRWTLLSPDAALVQTLMNTINVSEPIARCLVNRGITDFESAKKFFRPSLSELHAPFLMSGMKEAATRLSAAIDNGERIMIYGDYDVDGTTGTSLLVLFLKKLGASVNFYVNDRQREGYGIAKSGIDYAKSLNVKVIVSVDCGITAHKEALLCNEYGIDFIICDHHEAKAEPPAALAVLDAKQPHCNYPFKELSGCGVAFKLAEAICEVRGVDKEIAYSFLDFVALAVAADIVPVVDENRALMAEGIKRLQQGVRLSLATMATVAGLKSESMNATNIVFTLSPRINAAGRLDHAREAIKLLTSEDDREALESATLLDELNKNRRVLDQEIFHEADEDAQRLLTQYPSSIVLYKPEWHLGVIGIVASRIVERFYVPTIILTENGGKLKGSARSVARFNLYKAIGACAAHLIQFGGHEAAAGLTMEIAKLDAFRSAFDKVCGEQLELDMRQPELAIDSSVTLEQITPKFVKVLNQFEPCGPKNLQPLFLTEKARVAYRPKILKEQHLKFSVRDENGRVFDCIGFGMAHHFETLSAKGVADIVYHIEENEWNGNVRTQLRLKDIRFE